MAPVYVLPVTGAGNGTQPKNTDGSGGTFCWLSLWAAIVQSGHRASIEGGSIGRYSIWASFQRTLT